MTEEDLIDDIFRKEGDAYGDQTTHPPIDQPTGRGGIVLETLTQYRGRPCTIQDLKDLTREQARAVIRWKLREIAKHTQIDAIVHAPLRLQMIDFAYNSGEGLALRWLQRVLRVPRSSRMDEATRTQLARSDPWLVHHALIAARLQMVDGATDPGGKVDKRFEEGLENRALTFSLLDVP